MVRTGTTIATTTLDHWDRQANMIGTTHNMAAIIAEMDTTIPIRIITTSSRVVIHMGHVVKTEKLWQKFWKILTKIDIENWFQRDHTVAMIGTIWEAAIEISVMTAIGRDIAVVVVVELALDMTKGISGLGMRVTGKMFHRNYIDEKEKIIVEVK